MAVDFSLLPVEKASNDNAPSRFVWTVAFFLMVLIGILAMLYFWPADMPTKTWEFWISLILFPVGIPAFIVLRRYSSHAGRVLDTAMHNEAVHDYHTHVFEAASMPLSVMGAAYRFSANRKENHTDGIGAGTVTLKTLDPIARNGEPVKARWLTVPDMQTKPGGVEDDRNRRRQVTAWLFDELLDELKGQVRNVPPRVPLVIRLCLSNGFTFKENQALWQERWSARALRQASVAPDEASPVDLMGLDTWLDAALRNTDLHATLLVAVQLHALLAATPPAGTAEAGVALLLMPAVPTRQLCVPHIAQLHRPVRGPVDQPGEALSHALRWGGTEASQITGGWQTGLDAKAAGALREPVMQLGIKVRATDLDQTVGDARIAAPWLAIACAASSATAAGVAQMVLVGHDAHVDGLVLNHVSLPTPSPASVDERLGITAPPSLDPRHSRATS